MARVSDAAVNGSRDWKSGIMALHSSARHDRT